MPINSEVDPVWLVLGQGGANCSNVRVKGWNVIVDIPQPVGPIDCTIYERPDFDTNTQVLREFVVWLRNNRQQFVKNVAYQSFNMDLIRDDLEEDYLANHIGLKHVNVLDSVVCVVADLSSFLKKNIYT
jgi:hypothetical protein